MKPPALPENLRNSLRIAWHLSNWCNYSCQYCGVLVFHKRARNGGVQAHAFDYQPVERWLDVFRAFPQRDIYLKITGGEPFLDRANFLALLEGLERTGRYTIRIDTNGSWDPAFFAGLDKTRILLNVSYHPGEVEFEAFRKRIRQIRAAGFRVAMVNFVLAPENIGAAERTLARLRKDGFFVNVSAMIPTGAYTARDERTPRELELLENYNTPIDLHFRLVNPVTRGRLCFHPAFSYYMLYDGSIKVYCGGQLQNIFTDGPPALPREAVPCPYDHCESCVEMYRALTDEPLVTRPLSLYPLDEYVEEVEEYRRSRRWKTAFSNLRHRLRRPFSVPEGMSGNGLVAIQPAAGGLTGAVDAGSIEARSRDRVLLSGWAGGASGPVREIRLRAGGQEIGVVRHFLPRADASERGWQTMVYLPALPKGDYSITAEAVAQDGAAAVLPPVPLHIIE